MAKSGDRFYQFAFRHRPAFHGDVGSLIKIDGLVVGGAGGRAILMLPTATDPLSIPLVPVTLTDEEWSDWIQRSDDPEILVGPAKVFHRKLRYEISGAIQQKIWMADALKCMYCRKVMGQVQLTIDHFMPLELGGKNDVTNYISACRRCNKDKGSEHPLVFCQRRGIDFEELVHYLLDRKVV